MRPTCGPSDECKEERRQRGREESEAAEPVGGEEGDADGDAEGEDEEQVRDEEGQEAAAASEIVIKFTVICNAFLDSLNHTTVKIQIGYCDTSFGVA